MKRFKVFSLLLAAAVAATSVPMAVYGAENPAVGASAAVVRTAVTGAGGGTKVSSEKLGLPGVAGTALKAQSLSDDANNDADGAVNETENGASVNGNGSGNGSGGGADGSGTGGGADGADSASDSGGAAGTGDKDAAEGNQTTEPGGGTGNGTDNGTGDGIDGGTDDGNGAEGDEPGEQEGTGEPGELEDGETQPEPAAPAVTVKLNTVNHIRYMNGSSDGMFYPSSALTRAEAAQMIYSLLLDASDADIVQSVSFSDVAAGDWYAEAVNSLAGYGVINGVSGGGEGIFRPNSFISRAEFVTILSKFSQPVESNRTFSDVSKSHWAHDIIASAAEQGWISGYTDGTFHPDGTLSRAEAAVVVNRVLGRSADKNTVGSSAGVRIFPDLEKWRWAYYDIMEATIGHEHSGNRSSEVWTSFTKEKTALSAGTHVINGVLYLVKSDGTFAANEYVDGHWYDTSGKYVTGNATLDELMRSATRACVKAGMTQHQMLQATFNYMINNYTYLSRAKLATGATGWTEEYAVPMFQKHKGNCYSFAAAYYYLAKNIGYNPREVAGLVGHNRRPHGWIEIDIAGTTYIYDTELTMAKRRDGYNYYLFEMTYRNAPFVYSKS